MKKKTIKKKLFILFMTILHSQKSSY